MGKELFIEEYHDPTLKKVKYEHLGAYYDTSTGFMVLKRRIETDLEIGGVYLFTYQDEYDEIEDAYTYAVLKRENNIYYIAEYFDGEFISWDVGLLGEGWKKCDVKQELGIDFDTFIEAECEFCKYFDFRQIEVTETVQGMTLIKTANVDKFNRDNGFKFCPLCGRKLVEEDF